MDYIQVVLSLDNAPEIMVELFKDSLLEIGFNSFVDTDKGIEAYCPEQEFDRAGLEERLEKFLGSNVETMEINKIADQNWNYVWEQTSPSVRFADLCLVRKDSQPKDSKVKYDIIINPCQSFGTATHPTTAMIIEILLAMQSLKGKKVMDMGCGTAVLAILAKKMGAEYVEAIDIDKWAYENALANVARNEVEVCVKLGGADSITPDENFDVFLANINLNILKDNLKYYSEHIKTNSLLILSGFYQEDIQELEKVTSSYGFVVENKHIREEWAAIILKKAKDL